VIGTRNEMSLHAALKEHYRRPGDIVEGKIGNYIIDLVQKDRLVEIQTGNFSALKNKFEELLKKHSIHLVYPIPKERYLVYVAPRTGELLNRRKSPKKGTVYDLFSELIRIPHLICHPRLTIEAVLISEEELRCDDGRGSWRRRGVSILDRRLVEVKESSVFAKPADFLAVLPQDLATPFTNKNLAAAVGITASQARKVNYTLKKADLIEEVGKNGNEILHAIV